MTKQRTTCPLTTASRLHLRSSLQQTPSGCTHSWDSPKHRIWLLTQGCMRCTMPPTQDCPSEHCTDMGDDTSPILTGRSTTCARRTRTIFLGEEGTAWAFFLWGAHSMQVQSIGRLPDIMPHAGADSGCVDLASPPAGSAYQRLAAGGIALLVLAACWGAWVFLIGFQPCSVSSLLWR